MSNQAPTEEAISVSRVKISEPKPFYGARDAKALENYIFDLEQYFRATNTVTEEAKVTLAMMHSSEDAKLWWRSRYVDMQEGCCTIDTWDALKKELRSQFFPENIEILARRNLWVKPWAKTSGQCMQRSNGCLIWPVPLKMRDIIKVPHLERNRNSRSSSPKAVGGDKCSGKDRRPYQSNIEKTCPTQEEPSFITILLAVLGKLGETVPKDTLCVLEKCHVVMPNSWPKSLSMQRMINHGIELLPEAKAPAKNAYCMAPPELPNLQKPSKKLLSIGFSRPVQALYCRVRATKVVGLETTCVTGFRAYEFLVVPFSLTDAKGGKCCSMQRQINVLDHVVEFHQIEAVFDGLKQATIEGPSFGVTDATKPPKVEAEQFNYMLEEYLHHFVDGRQRNSVRMLNEVQFGHDAQTDSLIRRRNSPQVYRVEKEWEQMADIARACLEEASRPMEERVDQKRCLLEFGG
ncbi:uncharacterized protein E5676_scaffold45G001270 [Cucumis melo var. makuwa]|uniref:Retrotransposon gag domain-containing protein n=1 Tax=Cucumis melo var. makuwa TaxID=1194695 RepID=A0A5D3CVW2_CUCMM|nr:uncharacterized protein E5676_scaffold45G001270 [Cucumis melo var. makuwa]